MKWREVQDAEVVCRNGVRECSVYCLLMLTVALTHEVQRTDVVLGESLHREGAVVQVVDGRQVKSRTVW